MMTVEQGYDQLAPTYDSHYQRKFDLAENWALARWLRERLDLTGNTIDLGCGTGLFLELLPDYRNWYVGVDISAKMLEVALARFHRPNTTWHHGDMLKLNPTYHVTNVVSLFHPFCYLPDITKGISQINRLIPVGGRVFIMLLGKRSDHSVEDVPHRHYESQPIKEDFYTYGAMEVDVVGFNWLTRKLPTWLPQWFFNWFCYLESKTLGRLFPDRFDYLMVMSK